MTDELTFDALASLLKEQVREVQEEPEFQRTPGSEKYAVENDGGPAVKMAVANVPLEYDLWQGLRNPATIGLYPAGLPEIWDYYANRRKKKVDEAGRPSIFQVPRTFDYARERFGRALLITMMLPFAGRIMDTYIDDINETKAASSYRYQRMYDQVNGILDRAVTRMAITLVTDESRRVIMAMNGENVTNLSKESIPETHRGGSHGPSKGGNFPQKSLAALTGLGQFGIQRIIFRDEMAGNKIDRFTGALRSVIIFDTADPVMNGAGGIFYPSLAWRNFLGRLYDFTDTDPEINSYRFCTHIPQDDNGCGKCIEYCPSGAQPSSTPLPTGEYSEQVSRQGHRFWEGKLQFDYAKCTDERGQMSGILSEWSCSRCLTVCASRGVRRKATAAGFYRKMSELGAGEATAEAAV